MEIEATPTSGLVARARQEATLGRVSERVLCELQTRVAWYGCPPEDRALIEALDLEVLRGASGFTKLPPVAIPLPAGKSPEEPPKYYQLHRGIGQAGHGPPETEAPILMILGAGCSVSCGYPLASEMRGRMAEFARTLGDDAAGLRKVVEQTTGLFDELEKARIKVDTLDQLCLAVHQGLPGTGSGAAARQRAFPLIEAAKHAVSAFFLSLEPQAIESGLSAYRNLIRRVFATKYGDGYRQTLASTPYRVLTFNYDRLFELAFGQFYKVESPGALYGPEILNSGMSFRSHKQLEIAPNRFCFLKLHGSVGWQAFDGGPWGLEHQFGIPNPSTSLIANDANLMPPKRDPDDPIRRSLIAFPHEKDLLSQYPENKLPYRTYIPSVWTAAKAVAADCREIWVVGYSCPEPDEPAFRQILGAAVKCDRLVVQNPSAKDICSRLRARLPGWAPRIEPYEASFEKG